jgi:hypothetical protein
MMRHVSQDTRRCGVLVSPLCWVIVLLLAWHENSVTADTAMASWDENTLGLNVTKLDCGLRLLALNYGEL